MQHSRVVHSLNAWSSIWGRSMYRIVFFPLIILECIHFLGCSSDPGICSGPAVADIGTGLGEECVHPYHYGETMCQQMVVCGIDVVCIAYMEKGCECPPPHYDIPCCPISIVDLEDKQTIDDSYDEEPGIPGIQLKVLVDASCLPASVEGWGEIWIGMCDQDRFDMSLYYSLIPGRVVEAIVDLGETSGCKKICSEIRGGGSTDQVEVCLQ